MHNRPISYKIIEEERRTASLRGCIVSHRFGEGLQCTGTTLKSLRARTMARRRRNPYRRRRCTCRRMTSTKSASENKGSLFSIPGRFFLGEEPFDAPLTGRKGRRRGKGESGSVHTYTWGSRWRMLQNQWRPCLHPGPEKTEGGASSPDTLVVIAVCVAISQVPVVRSAFVLR